MKKYNKISKEDAFKKVMGCSFDFWNPIQGAINITNLASLLKTSKYQVKKYIDELVKEEFIELKCFTIYDEDEVFPPYWGYVLTEKGKSTEIYIKQKFINDKLFEDWTKEIDRKVLELNSK